MDFSNTQNTPKKNQALVIVAFIMGIASLICAFTCLSFLAPVLGGLSILFALLSKGSDEAFEKKAKQGLILSTVSVIVSVILMTCTFIYTISTSLEIMSQYEPDELHDYLNEAYEETYGKSFDELYKEIYGEDFGEIYEDMFKDISDEL